MIYNALGAFLCELVAFASRDEEMLELGELSSEIWRLVKNKDKKTIQLSIKVFKEILEGIETLSKEKS